ncbi:bifunctional 3,4-dihydroxy-2-butanone-4-phosphate synthase/GTP cyclohydrolase II [Rivihabitans pingtungensis]|uniref:3,4-dihydroxy-2-butanone 4-phosphate synthase n=1 Tax=Rivihabitans pingtungensis TaxID=1054498 RepID=A0A318KEP5_9NEIS|nr:bifunctional 3,4-dihydroxy-2-butanone-4-phosphate synthase/GTP cyclohydrolase II [Rivihabitans pingtungensis]PXX75810.1 GTP cyclohydrolase II /3,4-dihydroxy-2-butanone 4-phosphate synthase [Rivihabitans pingtungensis]
MLSPIQDIIADIKAGKMVILVDEEDRENEGDLVLAAEHVTPEAINFMAKYARGLICLTLSEARCRQLNLPLMVSNNGSSHGTNFTLSIEAAEGVTTGISAADRARTVQAAVARHAKPSDIVQPGHIFPLKAQNGGVLVRAGHTEAGCDLAALAGLEPASVICEIMNDDGTMARLPELLVFAEQHGLKVGAISDLIHYRSRHECLIEQVGKRQVATPFGEFTLHAFRDNTTNETHLALSKGDIRPDADTLVRVHEPLSVMDWLDAGQSPHSWSVAQALAKINADGKGVVVLLHRTEHGAELLERALPDLNAERPRAKWDAKTFGIGAQMLKALGVGRMTLLSQPRKIPSMTGFGLEVSGYLLPEAAHA